MADGNKYTIIGADGLYPDDSSELAIFAPSTGQNYTFEYLQTHLWPHGSTEPRPWSSIPEDLRNRVDGILLLKLWFTGKDLELFPNLKVIVRMGVGYDRLDRAALALRHVTVCNVPDYGTAEVADHALALALSLRRGILLHHDRQRGPPGEAGARGWGHIETSPPLVARLQNQTFGVLGLGRIGTAAALRAKALGFRVLFHDPHLPNGVDRALGLERTRDIADLFARSHVLSVHCPATGPTRGLVGWGLLSRMPRGAVLVNTARGEVVDLDGVERALREGVLAGVGLDVLPEEPVPEDRVHPLLRAYRAREPWLEGRMVLTAHSAFYSPESFEDIRTLSARTMRDVLIEGLRTNVITPGME